jgi:hypothetical protein
MHKLNFDVECIFFAYLALLKVHDCFKKEFGEVPTLLNVHKHGMGASFFKVTMQAN